MCCVAGSRALSGRQSCRTSDTCKERGPVSPTHLDNHDKPRTDSITDFLTVATANLYPPDVCTPMGGKTPADEGALSWKELFPRKTSTAEIFSSWKVTVHLHASDYVCRSAEVSKQQYRLLDLAML